MRKPMRVLCEGCHEMFSQETWKQRKCPTCRDKRRRAARAIEEGPLPEDVRWSKWLQATLEPLVGRLSATEFNQVYRRLIMAEHKEKAA